MVTTKQEILDELRALATKDPKNVAKRWLVPIETVLGVPTAAIRKLAKSMSIDHDLIEELRSSRFHEAKILAILLFPISKITTSQLDRWLDDITDWSVCDLFAKSLAVHSVGGAANA